MKVTGLDFCCYRRCYKLMDLDAVMGNENGR